MAKLQGWKEPFQTKKKLPKLPRQKKEPEERNPWGGVITPALQRFIDERRKKADEAKSARKNINQDAKKG